jgi:hypothetical protein
MEATTNGERNAWRNKKIQPPDQGVLPLRACIHVEKKMGESMGTGEILL